ncbi:MAG: PKD domain-containing protein [Armatimonadetes bacterium]|nr:PKD domain-containing protein [Armatimonadota bacterium]
MKTTLLALTALFAATAHAQTLYTPTRSAKDQGMSFKSWGSGTIAETDEAAFEGTTSIRVSSRNFFQGGIVTFATPVDLGAAYADKNNLLQFVLRIPASATGSAPAAGGGAAGGGKGPGRGSGLAGGESGGGSQNEGAGASAPVGLENIRLVLTTSDGLKSEAFLEVKGRGADERGWTKAGIPLHAIRGFDRTNKSVTSIALAGDATATFYIGEVGVLNDATPVFGEITQGDLNLALGDVVNFIANGYAGSSPLKFEWDFDAADGLQVDATNQVVKRRFSKPGTYVVTLTVTDVYGLKAPHTSKINVVVNP